jgi:aminoglycoside phosphotransferase (APT) family kinase protein
MMHDDEIEISDDVVRELIIDQYPQWEHAPIRRIESSGTVNAIFRIGSDLAARFPLRPADPDVTRRGLADEARASTEFAQWSPVPSPVPLTIGEPGLGYPLPWSVQTWIQGTVAANDDTSRSEEFAHDLVTLITALRGADTLGRRFSGGGRGGDFHVHDEWIVTCLRESARLFDVTGLAELWSTFRDLPRMSPDVMTHRDLTPSNVLVHGGRLVGVLDCGSFGPADPALDVIAGWHLLDDGPRALFRTELQCDDNEWERGRAWAFVQALGAGWYYVDSNPVMYDMGRRTLQRVVANGSTG